MPARPRARSRRTPRPPSPTSSSPDDHLGTDTVAAARSASTLGGRRARRACRRMTRLVGARVPRVEDRRLLRGRGHFVDDLHPPGLRHAAFVRSPFAHASVTAVDVTAARAMPGVDLVLTAADLHDVVGVMQGAGPEGLHTPAFGPLASDRVRFVGDPVAVVIAASRALAEDACERVDVTYHPLPALADVDTALASDAPAMFEAVGHNLMFEGHWTYGDPDAHFAAATRRGRWRFTQHRQCNAPLEGRAGLVDHDLDTGDFTYHAAHQNPHALRLFVADLLGIPAHRFHVHVGDVGGSFGQKAYVSREDVAVCAAGTLLGQPVKW